jgi:hypothetical protein
MNSPKRSTPAARDVKLVELRVVAISIGTSLTVLDRRGRRICNLKRDRLCRRADTRILHEWRWRSAAKTQISRLLSRCKSRACDPWTVKAQNLAASVRLRSFDLRRPRTRQRFEAYQTEDWDRAARRLWQQANNRRRVRERSGWARWSHTVSNNFNKRKGGRYAKAQDRHCEDGYASC